MLLKYRSMFDEITGENKSVYKKKDICCHQSFFFKHTLFSPVIFSNIYHYFKNIFHECKVLKKVITTEIFNIHFQNKFIKFGIICFFDFSFISIYIDKMLT